MVHVSKSDVWGANDARVQMSKRTVLAVRVAVEVVQAVDAREDPTVAAAVRVLLNHVLLERLLTRHAHKRDHVCARANCASRASRESRPCA